MTVEEMLGSSWFKQIGDEFDKPYMQTLSKKLGGRKFYPEPNNIFRAFKETPYEDVKIVLLGTDPYSNGEATGLCLETKSKMNTSLEKILEGMDDDLGVGDYLHQKNKLGYLAKRGVFMLNVALTVQPNKPGSDFAMWVPFTKRVIEELKKRELCYLIWGKHVERFVETVDPFFNLVLKAENPVRANMENRPWEHRNCFSQARDFVRKNFDKDFTF